jgi:hypothetical protein
MFPDAGRRPPDISTFSAKWERTVLQDWVSRGIDVCRSNTYEANDIETDSDWDSAKENGDSEEGSDTKERIGYKGSSDLEGNGDVENDGDSEDDTISESGSEWESVTTASDF